MTVLVHSGWVLATGKSNCSSLTSPVEQRPAAPLFLVASPPANSRLKQQNRESLESDFLAALMTNIPANIYFKDRESRFLRISKAQADWFGLSDPAEAVGKTDSDFFTPEHAEPALP